MINDYATEMLTHASLVFILALPYFGHDLKMQWAMTVRW